MTSSEENLLIASMWRSFTTHLIRQSPESGFALLSVSMLLRANAPAAWRIRAEPVQADINPGEPGDIESQWQSFGRHILAKAKDNKGFAVVNAEILVHEKRPLMWYEAILRRIYPMTYANDLGREIITKLLLTNYTSPKFDL